MVGQYVVGFHCLTSYRWSDTVCYRFPLLLVVQQVSTVISGPTLCVTYFHCYQWCNTVCYIFPLLSVVQHCVLHIPTLISGPTLCVTGFHCYQWSNTVCYMFPLLSVVQHSQPPSSSTSAPEAPPFCPGPSRCPRERTLWTSGGYSEVTPRKWLL